jgi:hypothetical protein
LFGVTRCRDYSCPFTTDETKCVIIPGCKLNGNGECEKGSSCAAFSGQICCGVELCSDVLCTWDESSKTCPG